MMEKMLFVDDDPICSFLNIALVQGLGMAKEVGELQSAEEALDYIQEHYGSKPLQRRTCPDFIFLDVHMPGIDGYELLQILESRQLLDKSQYQIVMLSSTLDPADVEKARLHRDKIYACLPKPLAAEDLKKICSDVLMAHQ